MQSSLGASLLPFAGTLPLSVAGAHRGKKKRLIIFFSPNGTVPNRFWPEHPGKDFELPPILQPFGKYQDQMLVLHGVNNRIRGDGDNHMRGMSCLLTASELFAGNIQGGSHTPAGWSKGISIDQEIKRFLQSSEETRTRFGSLEIGVLVPDRADPWTRMCYAGPNQPVAPISDPYYLYQKLYGDRQQRALLADVLKDLKQDFDRIGGEFSPADREMILRHEKIIEQSENDLEFAKRQTLEVEPPVFEMGIKNSNDNMPRLTQMQMDLLLSALRNDLCRVATFQFSRSVGQERMKWLDIPQSHHELSHEPDQNRESQDKLVKINCWYAEQIVYFLDQLASSKTPGTDRSLLDDTIVVWTNEMGKGNSHTLNNIPWVVFGGGLDCEMGRYIDYSAEQNKGVSHDRLLVTFAHAFGHQIETFGVPRLQRGGVLEELIG